MIIKPKVRGFVCTTSHPQGCIAHVNEQIEYVKNNKPEVTADSPKNVLVIGSSTGAPKGRNPFSAGSSQKNLTRKSTNTPPDNPGSQKIHFIPSFSKVALIK